MNNEQISQTELEDDFLLSETLGGYVYISYQQHKIIIFYLLLHSI